MKPRVAVVHPMLLPGGGSEAQAMGTIEALADDHRVTLITMGRPDLEALNRSCGTRVDPARVDVLTVAIPPGLRTWFDALRGYRLARYCRRHAGDFEVMISAYNVMDFGRPGIQMIADFSFDDNLRRELHAPAGPADALLKRGSAGRSAYLAFGRWLSGGGDGAWKANRTTACSAWVRDLLRDRFGVASEVVYPPVAAGARQVPWEDREDGFVVMGRLAPEKGIHQAIEILAEVRKKRPVHLHILGRRGRASYARKIEKLAARNRDWVHLEGAVYGPEKEALLAGHKYGLSGCRHEAFGIAVAEMVRAGQIVWVPDGGGQTEIVAHPGLIFSGPAQAAELILACLGAPACESEMRRHLEARAGLFSAARFAGEIRAVVKGFLEEKDARPA